MANISDETILPKVWITKYAMSSGVQIATNVKRCDGVNMSMIATNDAYRQTFHKPDWHETEEEAIARVGLMKKKRIASLQKQITKVERINVDHLFEDPKHL